MRAEWLESNSSNSSNSCVARYKDPLQISWWTTVRAVHKITDCGLTIVLGDLLVMNMLVPSDPIQVAFLDLLLVLSVI